MFLVGDRMVDPALAGESIISFLLYLLEEGRSGLLGSQVLPKESTQLLQSSLLGIAVVFW